MLTVIYLHENRSKALYDFKSLSKSFTDSNVSCTVKECEMKIISNDTTFQFTSNPDVIRGLSKSTTIVHKVY